MSYLFRSCSNSEEISRVEEVRIRELVNHLRDDRRNIASSVVHLEPLLTDPLTVNHPLPETEALKLDLENTVLMQELTAVREDRAELRAQVMKTLYLIYTLLINILHCKCSTYQRFYPR